MSENLIVSTVLPASPEEVFCAWLDSKQHSEFSESAAQIDPCPGGAFTTQDHYISGTTVEIHPFTRILQNWRTTDFPTSSPDSHLEIHIEKVENGTMLKLIHSNVPDGQAALYENGWEEYYFAPMQRYFARLQRTVKTVCMPCSA